MLFCNVAKYVDVFECTQITSMFCMGVLTNIGPNDCIGCGNKLIEYPVADFRGFRLIGLKSVNVTYFTCTYIPLQK